MQAKFRGITYYFRSKKSEEERTDFLVTLAGSKQEGIEVLH